MKVFVIILAFILSVVNNGFAQDGGTIISERAQFFEEYKHASAEKIWHDFMELWTKIGFGSGQLAGSGEKFKEPFSSWAAEEIIKVDLNSSELSFFLMGDFDDKYKKYVYEKHIDRITYPFQFADRSSISQEDYIIWVISSLGEWVNRSEVDDRARKFAYMYRAKLIERIVNSASLYGLSNNNLLTLLYNVSVDKKATIAQAILINNPSSYDLDIVGGSEIEFYSDLAKQMLSFDSSKDYDFDSTHSKFEFFKEKMINWPK